MGNFEDTFSHRIIKIVLGRWRGGSTGFYEYSKKNCGKCKIDSILRILLKFFAWDLAKNSPFSLLLYISYTSAELKGEKSPPSLYVNQWRSQGEREENPPPETGKLL